MRDAAALERSLHEALTGWAADHARRYPEIALLPYDPARYPGQRIDRVVTRTRFEVAGPPAPDVEALRRRDYERVLGIGAARVGEAVAPWIGELESRLAAGGNVVVLTAHADRLYDIGVFCGGLAIALEDVALIRRNGTILNKVMSREAFAGLPIEELFGLFGNVYWVIPETASAARWGIPGDAAGYVNANAMRAVLDDMRRGILLTIAPSGSAMRTRPGSDGEARSLEIPAVAASTANLVTRFDAYLLAALWNGELAVGPLTPMPVTAGGSRTARRRRQSELMRAIMAEMAAMVAGLAGVPVAYETGAAAERA